MEAMDIVNYIAYAIAGSTLIVAGLEKFAKITPSTKDDQWVKGAKLWLSQLAAILDKVAMNKRGEK